MKIAFWGAAQTVTGSCFVLETEETRFAIDCGLHQGSDKLAERNSNFAPYRPSQLDFFVITHAHMDHAGLLPLVVKHGFGGRIYATSPTVELLKIMLADSAHIQEMEAFAKNKRLLRRGGKTVPPLYTMADAQLVLPLLTPVDYGVAFVPAPGVTVTLQDAGHIIGSACVIVEAASSPPLKVVFSGDLGRPHQLIVNDPAVIESADCLVMESTYGDRAHRNEDQSLEELGEAIAHAHGKKGKVIIPAFAVERTQEVLYALHLLWRRGLLPEEMPVFVDSPLAIRATEVLKGARSFFDAETKALYAAGDDPFLLPNLHYTLSTQESMAINATDAPAIIISASGMANAGRIKHHLRHNLWRESSAVVFVGFQASGTIGRRIVEGAASVRIFNEEIAVAARVFTINGFSAHADQGQLLSWLANFTSPRMKVFLVHGEIRAQQILRGLIEERFHFPVHIPEYGEEVEIGRDTVLHHKHTPATPSDYENAIGEVEAALALLKQKGKPHDTHADSGDTLREVARNLRRMVSES